VIAGVGRRRPLPWLGGCGLLCGAALAFAPGDLGATVARGALLAVGLGVAAALVRRRGPARPIRRLELVERVALGRDGAAVLLRLDGRSLLLGVGRDGVRLLADGGQPGRGMP
jgi:hypothetical protein